MCSARQTSTLNTLSKRYPPLLRSPSPLSLESNDTSLSIQRRKSDLLARASDTPPVDLCDPLLIPPGNSWSLIPRNPDPRSGLIRLDLGRRLGDYIHWWMAGGNSAIAWHRMKDEDVRFFPLQQLLSTVFSPSASELPRRMSLVSLDWSIAALGC